MKMLRGKKTILGSIALGLLAAVYGLDQLIDPATMWLPYEVITGLVAAWTGVSLRLAVKNGG